MAKLPATDGSKNVLCSGCSFLVPSMYLACSFSVSRNSIGPKASPTCASLHLPNPSTSAVVEEPLGMRDGHVPTHPPQPRFQFVRLVVVLHDLELTPILDVPRGDAI